MRIVYPIVPFSSTLPYKVGLPLHCNVNIYYHVKMMDGMSKVSSCDAFKSEIWVVYLQ
jgi:hypothetical protein